jgi:deoxyribodipyrimidine photo-lyase
MPATPSIRIRPVNQAPIQPDRDFVLYWMIANRRRADNFSLQRAVEHAQALDKPLVILEKLRYGYRWNCDRFHAFVMQGMADNRRAFADAPVLYYPFVETGLHGAAGLLQALGKLACVVITDDFPTDNLPRMIAEAGEQLDVRLEAVDSNGLLPMRAADQVYTTAYAFRRFLQKALPGHLATFPDPDPLAGIALPRLPGLPQAITERWPTATEALLSATPAALASLPIDHGIPAVAGVCGGAETAQRVLAAFLDHRLQRYADERNEPEQPVASGLSPYLHFGHISVHTVFRELMDREGWTTAHLATKASGSRSGWWGASPAAEAFLDEIVTWRELGYNFCWQRSDYDQYESLPDWARQTLAEHAGDPRPYRYTRAELEAAQTHDPLWNAAQMQLVEEGRIHNYLRMLWGKKVLEWSATPQEALETLIELNNKYALDGCNPNSYSGIFWIFGRYDRAWGPERPIFGKIRYMSSDNTARKVRVGQYIRRYGSPLATKRFTN